MPMPGNLIITGEEQGLIEGSCELDDREGTILVQAFDHVVEIPTDERGVATMSHGEGDTRQRIEGVRSDRDEAAARRRCLQVGDSGRAREVERICRIGAQVELVLVESTVQIAIAHPRIERQGEQPLG